MNIKLIAFATTAASTIAGGSVLVYYLVSSENPKLKINPSGKTLKQKYPTLSVPRHGESTGTRSYDVTFWKEKYGKLKELQKNNNLIWQKLLQSIKNTASSTTYGLEDSYFNLTSDGNDFIIGSSEGARILSKYCVQKWDSEETSIIDYPDIMKELCTENKE